MVKIMKLYLKQLNRLIIVWCYVASNCFSQNDFMNHKKYWYYKTRFNSDFVKIDTGRGGSVPFNQRGFAGANNQIFSPSQDLRSGDATAQLGCYLSVLATEYRLLKNNGQDLTKIKHEIFCALNAINRLDYNAEYIFSDGTQNGSLNGFFIRDDIPKEYVKNNYKHFNYYSRDSFDVNGTPVLDPVDSRPYYHATDRGFTQTFNEGAYKSGGASVSYSNSISLGQSKNTALETAEESQDQAYYLLMGLALTSKLVDDVPDGNNVFGYGSGETKLQTEAKNIAGRIINHMKSDANWRIRNPANGNAFVQIGHLATPYSYALDNLGCFIKYGQDLPEFILSIPPQGPLSYPYNSCQDFSNAYSRSPAGSSGWHTVAYQNGGLAVDQMGFFHILAGSTNCVYESANASNILVQAAIDAAQSALAALYEEGENAVSNYLNGLDLPEWLKNTLEWVLQAVNAIWAGLQIRIDAAQNLYNHYAMAQNQGLVLNTTDYRLYQNTKNHSVNYFNQCDISNGNLPVSHMGSDAYFGTYLKDALRIDYPNQTLPTWVQFIKDNIYYNNRNTLNSDMINILNSAPCNGNYNYDPSNNPGPSWGATNRIDRTDHLWNLNCWKEGSQGDLAGLDYLLLHNLYYLTEGTSVPISNYSDRKVSMNMPFNLGNTLVFSSSNKKTMGAFEYLTAINIIASNGAADYRAGKEIALLDGFSTASGSDFHAFISPFNGTCNNDEMMRQNNAPGGDDFFDGISDYETSPIGNTPLKKGLVKNEYDENLAKEYEAQFEQWAKENMSTIENYDLNSQIDVYPNPNNGEFNIDFNLKGDQIVDVFIFDLLGKKLFEHKNVHGYLNLPVKLNELSKGVYLIKIIDKKGIENVKRLTIQ